MAMQWWASPYMVTSWTAVHCTVEGWNLAQYSFVMHLVYVMSNLWRWVVEHSTVFIRYEQLHPHSTIFATCADEVLFLLLRGGTWHSIHLLHTLCKWGKTCADEGWNTVLFSFVMSSFTSGLQLLLPDCVPQRGPVLDCSQCRCLDSSCLLTVFMLQMIVLSSAVPRALTSELLSTSMLPKMCPITYYPQINPGYNWG